MHSIYVHIYCIYWYISRAQNFCKQPYIYIYIISILSQSCLCDINKGKRVSCSFIHSFIHSSFIYLFIYYFQLRDNLCCVYMCQLVGAFICCRVWPQNVNGGWWILLCVSFTVRRLCFQFIGFACPTNQHPKKGKKSPHTFCAPHMNFSIKCVGHV